LLSVLLNIPKEEIKVIDEWRRKEEEQNNSKMHKEIPL